ncbi:MAG: site-specific integrase [Armatimonadota bacterium]|nr:site-specific integrase [bacterium]
MRGSVTQRSPGSWRLQWYCGKNEQGRDIYHNKTIRGGKKDAQAALHKILVELREGTHVEPCSQTLGEYLSYWLKQTKNSTVTDKTHENYSGWCNSHIIPALGSIRLDKLKSTDIQQYITDKLNGKSKLNGKETLSACSVRHHVTCLRTALNKAVQWQLIARSPMVGVELPRLPKTQIEIFTEEELRTLLTYTKTSRYYIPVVIASATGMRIGEIMALEWRNIDFARRLIHVTQAVESTGGKMNIKPPKNNKHRSIPVTQATMDILRAHKIATEQKAESLGESYLQNDWVSPTDYGELMRIESVKRFFPKLCKHAGISIHSIHTLRHTHASILLNRGVPIIAVSERLGHSSIEITVNTYGHLMRGTQDGIVDVLGTLAL